MSDYFIILINNKKYTIKRPTPDIIYQAQLEYENILTECKFNDWMSEQECISHLISIGKWTVEGEQKMKEIAKFIEDQKVALYQSATPDDGKLIRNHLWQAKDLLNRLYNVKTSLYSFTLPGFAHTFQQQYILENTIYHNDQLMTNISSKLLDQVRLKLYDFMIRTEEFRELARTDPWRSYWGMTDNPFSSSVVDLDYDKRTLLTYSKMYDNIYENPECPPENVLEDDDMLDGWMILQKRNRHEQKKEKRTDNVVTKLSSKYQNATEIFLPVKSQEQIEQINKMNSPTSQMVKKQRQTILANREQAEVGSLPDEVLAKTIQSNQQFKNSVKPK